MARRKRNKTPPPREAASLRSVLAEDAPAEAFQRRMRLDRWQSVALLNLLSAVLLSACFAPLDCWQFAYVGLVPLALAAAGGGKRRWVLLFGWLGGAVFWGVNLYWLWWVTFVGYVALAAYMSLYWLLAAALLRASARRGWPTWIVLPLMWTALEYARAHVMTGFPWFFLAHSQYRQTSLIQISDFAGQYGVSFLVAMVNGALVDALSAPLFVRRRDGSGRLAVGNLAGVALAAGLIAGAIGYGSWRLGQDTQQPGPVIGVVQDAYPIWLGTIPRAPDRATRDKWEGGRLSMLEGYSRATRDQLTGAGCDLVVWPETVLPPGMNREALQADVDKMGLDELRSLAVQFSPGNRPNIGKVSAERLRAFLKRTLVEQKSVDPAEEAEMDTSARALARKLAALSRRIGCPILTGGSTMHPNPDPVDSLDHWVTRNSALWFDGEAIPKAEYSKNHLVPFSEVVPFKHSWRGLYMLLRSFVPAVMHQLDAGADPVRITLSRRGKQWRLAPVICYEGAFARVCRRAVMEDGKKAADVLVNLSNDGWFVWKWQRFAGQGTNEQAQHLAQYCFRAVESRVPVVRSVNTGISALIDSNGRIVTEVKRGKARATMVAGTLVLGKGGGGAEFPQVLVDRRTTLYSIVGDVFAQGVTLVVVGVWLWLVYARWRSRRGGKEQGAHG